MFGGEIMESPREAGVDLGAHDVEILQTRSARANHGIVRKAYPAEILQDYENRIQQSKSLRVLNGTVERATHKQRSR
jgi:hypothetical protein